MTNALDGVSGHGRVTGLTEWLTIGLTVRGQQLGNFGLQTQA